MSAYMSVLNCLMPNVNFLSVFLLCVVLNEITFSVILSVVIPILITPTVIMLGVVMPKEILLYRWSFLILVSLC